MGSATETSRPAILEKAWTHHAELDTNADKLSKRHLKLRKWVIILGVIATFLAIITDMVNSQCPRGLSAQACNSVRAVLKVLLILTPLLGSLIAALISRELGDGRWLAMRAGAEEIKKEIYVYRTVLRQYPERNKWLSGRLADIQRQVYKASGSKLDTEPYKGTLPLYYSPNDPNGDAGFNDLTPAEYMRFRLQDQLSWHEGRIVRLSKAKRNLTIAILAMGVMGALLAGLGGTFAVWVALTASITAAFAGWEELRNRDQTIANYSKVKLELSIIRDYWYALTAVEQTDSAFYKMVLATENLMFAQNSEWMRSMQEALAGAEEEDKKLVEEMVALSATTHTELQQKLLSESQAVFAQATEQLSAVATDAAATVSGMVTAVSSEAIALNQTMADAVDTAVAQSAAARQTMTESIDAAAAEAEAARLTLEASRDTALEEVAAWRETAQDSASGAIAQATAVREATATAVATETAAWSATAQDSIDAAAATSATAREAAATEVDAWQETAQEAVDTAVAESTAVREAAAAAVATESTAWSDSAQDTVEAAAATSATARDAAAAQVDAWQETTQEVIDTAVAQSTAARDLAAAETGAWEDSSQAALAAAAAASAAAHDAAAAEAAAWAETAQEAVNTAVTKSGALRTTTSETIKFAVTFAPVTEVVEGAAAATAVSEQWAETVYTAVPDIKYPLSFDPVEPITAEHQHQPEEITDEAVDKAVDMLLEKGVQVADDSIKQALAKATQEDG